MYRPPGWNVTGKGIMRMVKTDKKNSKRYPAVFMAVIMAVSSTVLAGCGGIGNSVQEYADDFNMGQAGNASDRESPEADSEVKSAAVEPQRPEEESTENTGQTDGEASAEVMPQEEMAVPGEPESVVIPVLPPAGESLADFVADGWQLLDSVELDFNGDGITDYMGVQEADGEDGSCPRILFAVAGDGTGQYRLDFQNENLIRTRDEGGVFGDPYLPMTAEGASFSTHSYGGSAWRWAEVCTYEYRQDTWYLTLSEKICEYGGYITEYSQNDWVRGIGIRERRSAEFSDMEEHMNEDDPEYDLVYELALDEMPTLCQAAGRLSVSDRAADWEVRSVEVAEGIELAESLVEYPTQSTWFAYDDGDHALYTFKSEESGPDYIALYCRQDRKLTVVAEADPGAESLNLYKDSIYYVSGIVEGIRCRSVKEGKECIEEREYAVGVRLNRVNTDGTGQETVFEYRYPGTEQEILEKYPPYMSIIYEIGRDEIVLEVYIGKEPHPFYRMDLDGSGLEKIGQVPKE